MASPRLIYKGRKTEPRRGSTETTAGPLSLFSEEKERRICYSLTGSPGRPEPGDESLAGENLYREILRREGVTRQRISYFFLSKRLNI